MVEPPRILRPLAFRTFRDRPTTSDLRSHIVARARLLNRLRDDLRVQHLFETEGGFWNSAVEFAAMLDAAADIAGADNRTAMVREVLASPALSTAIDADIERDHPTFMEDLRAQDAAVTDQMRRAVDQLVFETWRLPRDHPREDWSWLVDDLVQLWQLELHVIATGGSAVLLVFSAQEPTPAIQVEFRQRPDESIHEARERLKQVYLDSDAKLAQSESAAFDTAVVERDVDWVYRNVLKEPKDSKRKLSTEYVEDAKQQGRHLRPDQRGTIQAGIARGRRRLSGLLVTIPPADGV